METVSNLAQSVETNLNHSVEQGKCEKPIKPDDQTWITKEHLLKMDMVFDYMASTYGHMWNNLFADANAIEEAKLSWLATMGCVHHQAIYKARWKLPDAFGSGDKMPGPLEFKDLVHAQYDSAFKFPSFERVAMNLSNPYWKPGDTGEEVLSTSCMIYWAILQEANKDVPVSILRTKSERVFERSLKKLYDFCKRKIVYGVKYLPPKHIQDLAEKNLLEQKMSKADSDAFLDSNWKETGRRTLDACLETVRKKQQGVA